MKILIRADGGKTIGMGHIMRTSVLADELKEFAEVSYVCLEGEDYQFGVNYLMQKGYHVFLISKEEMANKLKSIEYDCLIVDSYHVDLKLFQTLKKANTLLGYIDDLKVEEYPIDFIINQNSYAKDLHYQEENYMKTFLGVKYALLRKEFQNKRKRFIRSDLKDIMITVGGSDINRITESLVFNILKTKQDVTLHVVVGPAFPPHILENIISPNIQIYYNPSMSKLMESCDLAISACGSTVYELAACGTPTIGIIVADNQIMTSKKLEQLGIIKASNIENISESMKEMTYEKRLEMSGKGQKLVDGLGAKRLASEIINLIHESMAGA